MVLQKNGPIPLYYQLMEHLREQIESGQIAPGARLPSVQELSATYQISPMTVHKALNELGRQGILEVQRGIGTFVARTKIPYDLLQLVSFTEAMAARGLSTHAQLLEFSRSQPTPSVARKLEIPPTEETIHLVRLRHTNDTPAVREESYFPSRMLPGLSRADLAEHSLYTLLETRYGLVLDHATQTMEAASATVYESELLGIPLNAPVVIIRGVTYLANGRPIESFKVLYRADCFKFQLETVRLRKKE